MGLSPRVRGNPCQLPIDRHRCGSIPACAGEPKAIVRNCRDDKVYPRVCGGTSSCPASKRLPFRRGLSPRVRGNRIESESGAGLSKCQGLSPRVRGNRLVASLSVTTGFTGSIPACAGEPRLSESSRVLTRVYPRVCGGTLNASHGNCSTQGLSPRVRGNLIHDAARFCSLVGVYPRVCGGTQ